MTQNHAPADGRAAMDTRVPCRLVASRHLAFPAFALQLTNVIGILFSNDLNLDQGSFSNVQYSVIAEPSAALLGGLGLLALLRRRC